MSAREKALADYIELLDEPLSKAVAAAAFGAVWDAARADMPDRDAISRTLMRAAGVHGPISTIDWEGIVTTDLTPLVDAIDALLRGEGN